MWPFGFEAKCVGKSLIFSDIFDINRSSIYCNFSTVKGSKDLLIQKRFVRMTFFLNIKCIAKCAKNEINHFVAWYELSNIEKVSCAFLEYKVVFPLGQYKSGTSYSKHVHDHTFFVTKTLHL